MPGPKTHEISYKQLKSKLDRKTLAAFPNYDKYSLFAQGHDFLIYHNYYKIRTQQELDLNVHNSVLLQEFSFQEFIYNFLDAARRNGAIEEEQVRLFIGPGYILHHILDAYTHPLIIYYSGDHKRNPDETTWKHGIVENLIDMYMMKRYENVNHKNCKVYKDFAINVKEISPLLITTLNESLEKTYNMINGGEIFLKSFSQVWWYMKALKYDRTGLKRIIFDYLDPKLVGTSSFSYHRNFGEVRKYLNIEREVWLNPMDDKIVSRESFMDLYRKAVEYVATIVNSLEKVCWNGNFNRDDIYSIIPNKASTHGLECGKTLEIKYRKQW